MGGEYQQYDSDYQRLSSKCYNRERIVATVLGDSHGVRLYLSLRDLLNHQPAGYRQFYLAPNASTGGARATYLRHYVQDNDRTDVVILWIQGNDLDEVYPGRMWHSNRAKEAYVRGQLVRGIFRIFLELTMIHRKTVYVMFCPSRFRLRYAVPQRYNIMVRRLNNQIRKFIKSRCIILPDECYSRPAFCRDYVHLRPEVYDQLAVQVLQYIRYDMYYIRTRPAQILRRIQNWMTRPGQQY